MAVKKAFADEKGMFSVDCPFCGEYSRKPVDQFPVHQSASITCSCGNAYEVDIETRKDSRKKTDLKGYYTKGGDSINDFERMTVIDLTIDGCCLLVSDKHRLTVGDSIKVMFKLNNAGRTEIKRVATVRWIAGSKVGCQLSRHTYDPELGFYLKDFKTP